jgi:hypothetical protein
MAASLGGCADWQGLMNEESGKYMGKPVEEMYSEWGAPKNSAPLSNGGKYYEFVATRNMGAICKMSAWTDASGKVTELQLGGMNGCAAPF